MRKTRFGELFSLAGSLPISFKDIQVQDIWTGKDGEVAVIDCPDFYEESGTPVCPESGEEMEYVGRIYKVRIYSEGFETELVFEDEKVKDLNEKREGGER